MDVEHNLNRAKLDVETRAEVARCLYDSERAELELTEDMVQFALAVVVPVLLALMLFSHFLLPVLAPVFLLLAVFAAASMMIPAVRMHRLHFRAWSIDSLVPKLLTAVIGMIYIAVVSTFAISMLSLLEGFAPEQPVTFATVGALLIALIVVMTYSSSVKNRYLTTEKRFFPYPAEAVEERLAIRLERVGHRHRRGKGPSGGHFEMEGTELHVHVRRLNKRQSEVLVRNITESNRQYLSALKACIEGA
jgi:hypothetical protein